MASGEEVEELVVEVPWGVVAAKCWNSRGARPVLVAHGLGENAGAFDRLVPLLSKEFFYVVVDLPGHGRSSAFPEGLPLNFMNYVSQLDRIVSHFGWQKLSLMGHSFGAHLLIFFAATFTAKVERLILIDAISPTPLHPDMYLLFHLNQTNDLHRQRPARRPTHYTYDQALRRLLTRRMSALHPDAAKPLLDRCLRPTPDGYVFTTDPRIRSEIRPPVGEALILAVLRTITCPVLVVLADHSEQLCLFNSPGFYPAALQALRRTHPLSSVRHVPGNHCVHNNHPHTVAPLLNRFLALPTSNL